MFKFQPVAFWGGLIVVLTALVDYVLPGLVNEGVALPEWMDIVGLVALLTVQAVRANNLTHTKAWLQETRARFDSSLPSA